MRALMVEDDFTSRTAFRLFCDGYLVKPIDKAKPMKYVKVFGLITDNG